MQRFFCPCLDISKDKVIVTDKNQIHHMRGVLRLKLKQEVLVFDEQGNEYDCIIEKLANPLTLTIKEKRLPVARNRKVMITLACAIPKKSQMDKIVDKLTQLGVDRIIPLETQRVVIKLDKQKKALRYLRWRKIGLAASQQSQRSNLPVIEPIKGIKEVLADLKDYDLKLIPTLTGEREKLRDVLDISQAKNIFVLIGPEGDFTEEEVNLAKAAGCVAVTLGELVLRVETAAVAVAGFIRLYENH